MSGYHKRDLDTFPMHKIKRVDRPTTQILEDKIKRVDERESGFNKARRGDYGARIQKEVSRFVWKHPLSASIVQMQGHLREIVDGIVAPQKAPIPEDPALLARHIKETAYFLRADAVGICKLPPYAIYTNTHPDGEPVRLNHKYAIAILIDQDWPTAQATSGHDWISNSMSFVAYSASGFIACILADYIRRLGYTARAHHARNYQVVLPPILLWAGLGEMCRISECVLHPFLGPRFKAAVVTTDLPLSVDKPLDFGLQDFCSKCKKCARECPSQALSHEGKVMYNGYEHWPSDIEKCTTMRAGNQKGTSCGTCITVCPWNKPYTPFHRAIGWTMMRSGLARSLAIWGDDLLGYGKPHPEKQWWLDLEDVNGDGVLTPPRRGRSGPWAPE
ncbi:MAG TPA: reductive dehalogenase [Syntrophorhabdales bacterium]|nr:reductive dehalogenase [Syntrophorhabdales bacterium]